MRRKYVSNGDVDTIVRLRRSGASWLKIEGTTGVPRRTAKRLFEEWQRSQVGEELKAARQQVAAQVFNRHMQDLMTLAQSIVTNLHDPEIGDRRDGTSILDSAFEKDIHGAGQEITNPVALRLDTERVVRQNRLLFSSLKEHSRHNVDWSHFDAWLKARDTWKAGLDILYPQASNLVSTIITQRAAARDNIDALRSDQVLANSMGRGAVEVACRAILDGKSDQIQKIEGYINLRQLQSKVAVLFGRDTSATDLIVTDKALADGVARICRQAVTNLIIGQTSPVVRGMVTVLGRMRENRQYLVDRLDELRLTPLILRTRCELCPA